MKRRVLQAAIKEMIRAHHEAFVVELFGHDRLGMSAEEVQRMWDKDLFPDTNMLTGVKISIPGFPDEINPFEYTALVAAATNKATQEQREAMRSWGINEWNKELGKELAIREGEEAAYAEERARNIPRPESQAVGTIDMSRPSSASTEPPTTRLPIAPEVQVPEWMSSQEEYSYKQAITFAGDFCRGLGNKVSDKADEWLVESWDGEQIVDEVDPEKRAAILAIIREKVADAIKYHWDSGQLSRELANATGNWSHNWEMIARTELQAVYNEGMVLGAIEDYGKDARIARLPETDACRHCERLFLDGGGLRIFPVQELIGNGTNVGRRAASWVATIFPVHPNCRCDTIAVPPGFTVTRDGRLRRDSEQS